MLGCSLQCWSDPSRREAHDAVLRMHPHLPTRRSRRSTQIRHIGGIGTVSGRAPLAPGGLPGFTGPFPSTSLDKGCSVGRCARHFNTHTAAMRRDETFTLSLAAAGFVSLGLPEGLLGVAWPSIRESFRPRLDALGMLLATLPAG